MVVVTNRTPFTTIYDSFLNRIEDSMYMEMTELDTIEQLQGMLVNALHRFRLPRVDIFDYEEGFFNDGETYQGVMSQDIEMPAVFWDGGYFNVVLSSEEINILSLCMVIEWLGQQLLTTEQSKMKFSGTDFKFSSQANHMAKLKLLIDKYEEENRAAQNDYKRRIRVGGEVRSTIGNIMSTPEYGYNI